MRIALILICLVGCDDGADGPAAASGRDAGESAACRFNSDCPPGFYCKERLCDLDCRTSRDCPQGQLCESGACLPPPCSGDGDCRAPAMICVEGACQPGCAEAGCPADQTCGADGHCLAFDCRRDGCEAGICDPGTGACGAGCVPPCVDEETCDPDTGRCVAPDFDCRSQGCPPDLQCDVETGDCEPPLFDCRRDGCPEGRSCEEETGRCVDAPFDCWREGCPQGERCDDDTGRCLPDGPRREPIGGPCERAHHCATDTCLSEPDNPAQGFCTAICCSENDCPAGFGCLYFSGARFCFPSRLFPTNNFSEPAGGRCGGGINDCRTGLCLDGRCLGSCCTDRDCLGAACVWLPTDDGSARAVCDRPNLLGGPAGSPCFGDLDCQNRICIPVPDAGGAPGICVDTCCTHGDCGGGFGCGQVQGPGGNIISACVPLSFGAAADAAGCLQDAECQSGHCVENVCRQPCCRDQDRNGACGAGERCLPRTNSDGSLIRVCTPPDAP